MDRNTEAAVRGYTARRRHTVTAAIRLVINGAEMSEQQAPLPFKWDRLWLTDIRRAL
jgi:hypothetical protein